ncbi:DUF5683 domain-containing protein [Flavobacterium sp. RHBU_24]|uniref:DUF5683 domain-containing protein n=1 Tax=Flavobacterium sp. RHBU_24 TaxID=3391185 RepID=UPI00398536A4
MKSYKYILAALLLFTISCFAQETPVTDPKPATTAPVAVDTTQPVIKPYKYNALAPAKAAFYSGVLPGLGQIYNKSYWKAPIVWGGLGLSIYSYTWNNKKHHEYRDAYKDLIAGKTLTGKLEGFDRERLESAQRFHQRNRDLSALITAGIYILNIIEANVDAHLSQFNVDDNLSLRPELQQNELDYKYSMGVTLSYQF